MKIFLDRNRTLLPRIDFIYFLTRCMTLVGIIWYFLYYDLKNIDHPLVFVLLGTYTAHLAYFFGAIKEKFDIKLAYLSTIIYDLIFLPFYILHSGAYDSSFFLLFFLTISVSAYVLRFWIAFLTTTLISILYLGVIYHSFAIDQLVGITMRLGFFWIFFLTISYASEYMRKSESRLLKLFDTLNLRTSELERSQAQLELIYENTRNLASILNPEGVIKEVIRILTQILQFENFSIILKHSINEFYYHCRSIDGRKNLHPKAVSSASSELLAKICNGDEAVLIKNIQARNDYTPIKENAEAVILIPLKSHGSVRGLLATEATSSDAFSEREIQILTIVAQSAGLALENAELHKRTEELSIIDDLTGANNYRYFVTKLQEEKKRAVRYSLPLSIIMVDIDWFKKLNDSYGHEIGNIVLKKLAEVIQSCIRDVDIFCRYGGEEFIVILPQTPSSEATVLAERIRRNIEVMVVETVTSGKLKVTVSVGVSSFPENGKSAEELVSTADQALYKAKDSGKNLVNTI